MSLFLFSFVMYNYCFVVLLLLYLWILCIASCAVFSHAHKATVMDVKWNPNGNWFGTASRDHLIKIYDIRMMKELWVLKGHKKDVNSMCKLNYYCYKVIVGNITNSFDGR